MSSADDRTWTPSEIRRRYLAGDRSFAGLDISDADDPASFRDAILDGAELDGAFVVADFSRASLRDCQFRGANVKTCIFDHADLSGSDFSDAAIDAATFRGARLDRSDFTGASESGQVLRRGEQPATG